MAGHYRRAGTTVDPTRLAVYPDDYGNYTSAWDSKEDTVNENYDPITLRSSKPLQAAADEMFAALRRTTMSAIIYEVLDMGTGITDGR
jgi:hypothetical protein